MFPNQQALLRHVEKSSPGPAASGREYAVNGRV
jgi:hypothetical protein